MSNAYFGLAAYMLPWKLGVGKLQAVGRLQQAFSQNGSSNQSIIDAFLNYVIDNADLKVTAGYQRQNLSVGPAWNALQFGVQLQR